VDPINGVVTAVFELILPALTSPINIALFELFIMVGGFVGLLECFGGAYALARTLGNKVTNARAQVSLLDRL
jgi:hypothetical protein